MKTRMEYIPPPEPQATYKFTMELSANERLDLIQVIRKARDTMLSNSEFLTSHDFLSSLGVKP